jgi:hypothetical protein
MIRVDETWHRLREWTAGQAPSERLAAQLGPDLTPYGVLALEGMIRQKKVEIWRSTVSHARRAAGDPTLPRS